MLHPNNHKTYRNGFTLVEMIVALGLFAVVAVVAVGALTRIVGDNRRAQALQTASNNISFVMESMSRELRVAGAINCSANDGTGLVTSNITSGQDCSINSATNNTSAVVAFKSARPAGVQVTDYKYAKRWVAVGSGGCAIAYSDDTNGSNDGVNWTCASTNTQIFSTGYAVAWNGNIFVAVGQPANGSSGSSIAYSRDGISWTPVSGGQNILSVGRSIVWNGNKFVAVGGVGYDYNKSIATSPDGINWTSSPESFAYYPITAISWNGSVFVIGTYYTNGSDQNPDSIYYAQDSPDPTTNTFNWQFFSGSDNYVISNALGLAWGDNLFVAAGSSNSGTGYNAFLSHTLANFPSTPIWTPTAGSGGICSSCNAIAWNGNEFVVVGNTTHNPQNRGIGTSPDGINWTSVPISNFSQGSWNGVAWNGNKFVAVGNAYNSNCAIIYSTNGNNWSCSGNAAGMFGNILGIASAPAPQMVPAINRSVVTQSTSYINSPSNPTSCGQEKLIYAYHFVPSGSGWTLEKYQQASCDPDTLSYQSFSPILDNNVTLTNYELKVSHNGVNPYPTIFLHLIGYVGIRDQDKSYFNVQTAISQRVRD